MYFKLFNLTKLVKNDRNSKFSFRCDINIILRKKSFRPPHPLVRFRKIFLNPPPPLASSVINGCRLTSNDVRCYEDMDGSIRESSKSGAVCLAYTTLMDVVNFSYSC